MTLLVKYADGPAEGVSRWVPYDVTDSFVSMEIQQQDDGSVERMFYRTAVDGSSTYIRSIIR